MADIYAWLAAHAIAYERHDHPAVFTVEDVDRLVPQLPGAKTKNLFFRDARGRRHFLVVVPDHKRIDLKALPSVLGCGKVSFGSEERLRRLLGVEPGAVSLLAVMNDVDRAVEVFIDAGLWSAAAFQFHPLVNTSTLVIQRAQVERFLKTTGHTAHIIEVPSPPEKA